MNKDLEARLKGMHASLMAAYSAGVQCTSATKGIEREIFVRRFLAQVLPPIFRFGHGDIIDTSQESSGQIDVVIENPFFPSLPIVDGGPRLYLAEGVAAALEVKSDIRAQWSEVQATASKLSKLWPCPGGIRGQSTLAMADCCVPLLAVGFTGWKTLGTAKRYIDREVVDSMLIIENGLLWIHEKYKVRNVENDPIAALWTFLCCLHDRVTSIQSISTTPLIYSDELVIKGCATQNEVSSKLA
jgi:hypothetical protein